MKTTKQVEVEVPELSELSIAQDHAAQLSALCAQVRSAQEKVSKYEKDKNALMDQLRPLAEQLKLPDRVLGDGWDLRRTPRTTDTLNQERLKLILLHLGLRMTVECPKTVLTDSGEVAVCSRCAGTGTITLEGIPAVNYLVDQCTDHKQSVSWAVYGRAPKEDK